MAALVAHFGEREESMRPSISNYSAARNVAGGWEAALVGLAARVTTNTLSTVDQMELADAQAVLGKHGDVRVWAVTLAQALGDY